MIVTGERAVTSAGGFNPSWQRHVSAYRLCARFLAAGPVLDLGCGTGHSFAELAPRETVGVDIDRAALAGQPRQTVVADIRRLPFDEASFESVLSAHSLEHVGDPETVLAEIVRVLAPGGTAVFVTPNRLTFGRPDEIIDPYHYLEWNPAELRDLCLPWFATVDLHGIFASDRQLQVHRAERRTLDRLLALDPLRLRRAVPRRARQLLYDVLLTSARRRPDPRAAAITVEDFRLGSERLDEAMDLVAVCRTQDLE